MIKKLKMIIVVLIAVIIVVSLFAAYELEVIEFDDDDDDGNGGSEPSKNKPVAIGHVNRTKAEVNEEITFNASASYDEDDNITSYRWNFDDGNTVDNMTVSHSYIAAGSYNVTLTLTDVAGNFNATSIYIGITHRESQSGDIQSGTDNFDFEMGAMATELYVNTTLENNFADPFSTEVILRLYFNGTEVWTETVDSTQNPHTEPYYNDTNLSAGSWTWEIEITDDALPEDVSWDVEIVIFYI